MALSKIVPKQQILAIKTFLAGRFSVFYYFYKHLGVRMLVTLFFNGLGILMDGFGLTLFIPLLKIADSSTAELQNPDKMTIAVQQFFGSLNLPLTVPIVLLFIITIFILKGIFTYLTSVFQGITLAHFSRNLRRGLISDLNNLNYKAFVGADFGRLQATVSSEAYRVETGAMYYIDTLKNILVVLVYIGMSVAMDYKFSLMVAFIGLAFNVLYKSFYKKTRERSNEITKIGHDITGNVMQGLYNFKYLKATNVSEMYKLRTFKIVEDILRTQISISKINALLLSIREPMMIIIVSFVILVEVMFFQVSISSIIIILLFFYRAMAYILSVQTSWNSFLMVSGALKNMQWFQSFLLQNREPETGGTDPGTIKKLEFKDVGLKFDNFKVIKNISLTITQKETVAFVGESGSGKSTLVNIACGLYLPDEGAYRVNGEDIHALDISKFRNRIGYISQEPTVFASTIYENVTLWADKTEENLKKFWNAVERSNLENFIKSLPEKEDALLGNSGINLSGGQKQRISIARELFKDIDILIMDEATSALDSETEKEVQKSIENLEGELIILIIAHRFATIVNADRIVVMKSGQIEDVGTFTELKQKSPYFNKLASLQAL